MREVGSTVQYSTGYRTLLTSVHLNPLSLHLLMQGVGRAIGGSAAHTGALLHLLDTSMHTALKEVVKRGSERGSEKR